MNHDNSGQDGIPDEDTVDPMQLLAVVAAKVQRLSAEQLAAEDDYIRLAAAAHNAGHLQWPGLIEAYERIRAGGRPRYSQRWLARIPYDLNTMRRFAAAAPSNEDGTWSGESGWEDLDKHRIPANGTHVAYALFGNAGTPIHISFTYKFRPCLKRLHKDGVQWSAWKAWPATNRADAVARRRQIAERYRCTNVAESDSETVPEFPTYPAKETTTTREKPTRNPRRGEVIRRATTITHQQPASSATPRKQ